MLTGKGWRRTVETETDRQTETERDTYLDKVRFLEMTAIIIIIIITKISGVLFVCF